MKIKRRVLLAYKGILERFARNCVDCPACWDDSWSSENGREYIVGCYFEPKSDTFTPKLVCVLPLLARLRAWKVKFDERRYWDEWAEFDPGDYFLDD